MLRLQLSEVFAAWVKVESLPFGARSPVSRGFTKTVAGRANSKEALLDVLAAAMIHVAKSQGLTPDSLFKMINEGRLGELARHLHNYHWVLLDFGVCREEVAEARLSRGILAPTLAEITTIDELSAEG